MIKFISPYRMMLVGPSSCGKSEFVARLIENQETLVQPPIGKIFYCTEFIDSIPKQIRNIVTFFQGVPTSEFVQSLNEPTLIVIDDLMAEAFDSSVVSKIFTHGRHRDISVILISQNLFPRYKNARNISLNVNYLVLFQCLRDTSWISPFSRQVSPLNTNLFKNLYYKYLSKPFEHLVFDFSPTTSDALRIRSDIFNEHPSIYLNDERIRKHRYETASPLCQIVVGL
jgi:hypothetical protein